MSNLAISSAGLTAVLNTRVFEQASVHTESGGIHASRKTGASNKTDPNAKNYKLERILTKFRSGKKLTSGELDYVAKENPQLYQKILRALNRREQVEKRLEAAKTKEEEDQIMAQEMKSVENIEDTFEKEATVNHLMDAYHEHIASGARNGKPDMNRELTEEVVRERKKKTGQDEEEKPFFKAALPDKETASGKGPFPVGEDGSGKNSSGNGNSNNDNSSKEAAFSEVGNPFSDGESKDRSGREIPSTAVDSRTSAKSRFSSVSRSVSATTAEGNASSCAAARVKGAKAAKKPPRKGRAATGINVRV